MMILFIPRSSRKSLHRKAFFGEKENDEQEDNDDHHKNAVIGTMEFGAYGTITNMLMDVETGDIDRRFFSKPKVEWTR